MIADPLRVSPYEQAAIFRATSFFTLPLSQDNLETLCNDIAQAVVREFGKIDCGVMLVDRDRYHVLRAARAGGYVVGARHQIMLDGPGLIAECLRTQQTLYVPDVRLHPKYIVGDPRTASELVIPLRAQGETLGVLDLQSPTFDAFSEQEQTILELFAERAAATLFNVLHAISLEEQVYEQTRALAEMQEQIESVFRHTSDALALTDAAGQIIRVNPAFEALFGYRNDSWSHLALGNLVAQRHQAQWKHTLMDLQRAGQARLEVQMVGKGGVHFTADAALSWMGQGAPGMLCSVRDISPRKHMELELRRALEQSRELTELKARFLTTASHEFRTPLAVILAATELLYFYGNRMTNEQRIDHLMQIKHGVEGVTSLLDNVLQVTASRERPSVDALDARAVIGYWVQAFRTGMASQHDLQLTFSGGQHSVWADAEQLRNLLSHLVNNAVKFSAPGSRVNVQVRLGRGYSLIRIRDEGIGIAKRDLPYLYDAFYKGSGTGEIPGAGLGLTIVKQIVDLHHGKIKIRSLADAGTTIVVWLPGQPA